MLQKNKMFTPHILPIVAGTAVDFPNSDPIFHNAFSSYDGQIFDVGLYPPGSSKSVRFGRPGVVRVFCNIHPAMSAIILVLQCIAVFRADGEGWLVSDGSSAGRVRSARLPRACHRADAGGTCAARIVVSGPAAAAFAPAMTVSGSGLSACGAQKQIRQGLHAAAE